MFPIIRTGDLVCPRQDFILLELGNYSGAAACGSCMFGNDSTWKPPNFAALDPLGLGPEQPVDFLCIARAAKSWR